MICESCQKSNNYQSDKNACCNNNENTLLVEAMTKLQNKIKLLENQVNDEKKTSKKAIKDYTTSNGVLISSHPTVKSLDKDMAKEALKMAEEKCSKLEHQLTTMRRLFLEKLVKQSSSKQPNLLDEMASKINAIRYSINDHKFTKYDIDDTIDDVNAYEDLPVVEENVYDLPTLNHNYQSTKFNNLSYYRNPTNLSKPLTGQNPMKSMKSQSLQQVSSYTPHPPFVAGGNTGLSYNRILSNHKTSFTRPVVKSNNYNRFQPHNNVAAQSNDYYIMCMDFEQLLDEKTRILDQMASTNSKDVLFRQLKLQLTDISKCLQRKKRQIQLCKQSIIPTN